MKIIINNKKHLLRTLIIPKLNNIITDIKTKSKIENIYNFNDKDKLFMINGDLDKHIKIFEKIPREYKTRFKNDVTQSG